MNDFDRDPGLRSGPSLGEAPSDETDRAPRWRRYWPHGLAALAVLAIIYILTHRGGGAANLFQRPDGKTHPIPVGTAPVTRGDIDLFVDALGTVTPLATVTVHSRVDGQIMRISFTEGQRVRAGELLAEIDPRPFEVQLTQARGQLARDEALLANARVDLDRYKALYAQDSIAQQQVATQEGLVRQYEGAVLADQGQVDSAKLNLIYSHVTAPVAGRVGLRQVDLGNVVHAADANGLVVITQLQPISVVGTIPEDRLAQVMKVLTKPPVAVEAYDRARTAKLADGELQTIDNEIDPTTGTVKLRALFANTDLALFPNQFVNLRVQAETLHGALLAPTAAVQRGAQGASYVYVVQADGTVQMRTIKPSAASGERTVIADGLKDGERVVVDGIDRLRDGAKVELVDRDAPPAAAPARDGSKGKREGGTHTGPGKRQGSQTTGS
jgi:membrane fusion protein, multidrug efflux system